MPRLISAFAHRWLSHCCDLASTAIGRAETLSVQQGSSSESCGANITLCEEAGGRALLRSNGATPSGVNCLAAHTALVHAFGTRHRAASQGSKGKDSNGRALSALHAFLLSNPVCDRPKAPRASGVPTFCSCAGRLTFHLQSGTSEARGKAGQGRSK